jgi:hypothetical protein
LRADGSLWTWGSASAIAFGSWTGTNLPGPVQLCRESDWVGFSESLVGGVKNQAGELWCLSPLSKLPGPDVPISRIGVRIVDKITSSAYGFLCRTNWTWASFETRGDGTLWATPRSGALTDPPTSPPARFGERSDWVSLWGTFDTTLGLTADGTLWTWGKDFGQPAHYEFGEKLGAIKETIATMLGAGPPAGILAVHENCGEC